MRALLNANHLLLITSLLVFNSCIKTVPGPGGTSEIKGLVTGQNVIFGQNEIQQITFTPGSQLEHGDYFLLNSVVSSSNYYIYFTNPNWVSESDPHLQGRIGLEVVFNYSDSNVEIAQAVKTKLASIGVLNFNMTLTGDILTLSYKNWAAILDPDNGSTSFAIDIVNQGNAAQIETSVLAMAEKRVYLCYNDDPYASQDTKTNSAGQFYFTGLQTGTYKVYTISKNPPFANEHIEVSKSVNITEKESVVDAGTLAIYF
ncbi:MAG: hypothetical protein RLZZ301_1716 [Bacteroidota bacterium]|jgi:hypothetical protein